MTFDSKVNSLGFKEHQLTPCWIAFDAPVRPHASQPYPHRRRGIGKQGGLGSVFEGGFTKFVLEVIIPIESCCYVSRIFWPHTTQSRATRNLNPL